MVGPELIYFTAIYLIRLPVLDVTLFDKSRSSK